MNFSLLLKQSFKDFKTKFSLYFTFTVFLAIAFSLVLGLSSFSLNLRNDIVSTFDSDRVNLKFETFNYTYEGTTINPDFAPEMDKWNIVPQQDQNQNQDQAKKDDFYSFIENLIIETTKNKPNLNKNFDVGLFINITGAMNGRLSQIEQNDIDTKIGLQNIKDKLTSQNIQEYNDLAKAILKTKYQWDKKPEYNEPFNLITSNILTGFIFEKLINQSPNNKFKPDMFSYQNNIASKFSWLVNPNLKEDYQDVPQLLKDYATLNNYKIYDQLNVEELNPEQNDLYKLGSYLFVTPKTLKSNNYKLGEIVKLFYKGKEENFLILGTANTLETILEQNDRRNYILSYKKYSELINDSNWLGYNNGNLHIGDLKVFETAYNRFITIFSPYFKNNTGPIYYEPSIRWLTDQEVMNISNLYTMLSYVIGIFALVLLFIVFYFITHQIILLQRKTLFFLKAMGVGNFTLTLLTTLAILTPLLGAGIIAIFGGSLVQNMMFVATNSAFSFIHPVFIFSRFFWLSLFGITIVISVLFFIINFLIINSKILTIGGINSVKAPSKFSIAFKNKTYGNLDSKSRIGVSFAFKNIYKNILTFVILSLSFGVMLFAVQFSSSLEYTSTAYENWNKPYSSVKFTEKINTLIDQKETANQNYSPFYSYQTVDNNEGLQKIDSLEAFEELVQDQNTDWSQYYLSQEFTHNLLEAMLTEQGQQVIKEIIDSLETDEEKELVQTIFDQITINYEKLKNDFGYDKGFNLYFGKSVLPSNDQSSSSSYLSVQSLTSYDFDNQKEFRLLLSDEENLEALNHFELSKDEDIMVDNKNRLIMNVNISSNFASSNSLSRGNIFAVSVPGLLDYSSNNKLELKTPNIYFRVKNILIQNTIDSEAYATKQLFYEYKKQYYEKLRQDIIDENEKKNPKNFNFDISSSEIDNPELITPYIDVYEKIINNVNSDGHFLDNSVYTKSDDDLPYSLKNIILPIYHVTDMSNPDNIKPGTKLLDYYDKNMANYYQSIPSGIYIFSIVTNKLLEKGDPFKDLMQKFIIILVFLAFAVSLILITLVLLENREIVLLFKSIGYKISEVNWYLITGYFISALLAMVLGGILGYYGIIKLSPFFYQTLGTSLVFIWSPTFFITASFSAFTFCLMMATSVILFTRLQKPRDAFAVL